MFVIPKYRYCCPAKNQKSKVLPFLSYRKVLLSGYSFKKYSRKITLRVPFVPSPYFRLNFVLELDSSSVDWTFLSFLSWVVVWGRKPALDVLIVKKLATGSKNNLPGGRILADQP